MNNTPRRVREPSPNVLDALLRQPSKKSKASVSVSSTLLAAADAVAGTAQRSALIERALRRYLRYLVRRQRHARELAILNANAARLNAEAREAKRDQVPVERA
ncbi:MAG: hypothetical protein EXR93_10720 [Gemmatimonadetes bacterium]|nr:hypothetical protein [Gemmatimonadota bacterium]